MKALDTNVLVRFLVNDNAAQAEKARQALKKADKSRETLLITAPVTLELIWVLGEVYDLSRATILDTLEQLLSMNVLEFQSRDTILALVNSGRNSKVDLPDLFIGLSGHDAGRSTTLTFDKKASKSDLFSLVN